MMEIQSDHSQLALNLDVNLIFELGDLGIFSVYSRDSESNKTIPDPTPTLTKTLLYCGIIP